MGNIYRQEIIPGKLKVDIVFETELVMAFHHTKPYWERHIVIIPKENIDSLSSYPNRAELNQDLFEAMRFVCKMLEDQYGGCRISSNVGEYQTSKHLHFYVHQGERLRSEAGEAMH
ncbi:MAG: HIT domain-containing protein [Bacteroidota bacterium]